MPIKDEAAAATDFEAFTDFKVHDFGPSRPNAQEKLFPYALYSAPTTHTEGLYTLTVHTRTACYWLVSLLVSTVQGLGNHADHLVQLIYSHWSAMMLCEPAPTLGTLGSQELFPLFCQRDYSILHVLSTLGTAQGGGRIEEGELKKKKLTRKNYSAHYQIHLPIQKQ